MISKTVEGYLYEEFKFCVCGCRKSKPKYTTRGKLASDYISTHVMKGKHPINYKGGYIDKLGYKRICKLDHKLADSKGYIHEHRYLFEQYHQCSLLEWSHIHHKNGNKVDNSKDNLEGMTHSNHIIITNQKDRSNYFCLICGSIKTWTNGKRQHWTKYKDGHLCSKCYNKKRREKLSQ